MVGKIIGEVQRARKGIGDSGKRLRQARDEFGAGTAKAGELSEKGFGRAQANSEEFGAEVTEATEAACKKGRRSTLEGGFFPFRKLEKLWKNAEGVRKMIKRGLEIAEVNPKIIGKGPGLAETGEHPSCWGLMSGMLKRQKETEINLGESYYPFESQKLGDVPEKAENFGICWSELAAFGKFRGAPEIQQRSGNFGTGWEMLGIDCRRLGEGWSWWKQVGSGREPIVGFCGNFTNPEVRQRDAIPVAEMSLWQRARKELLGSRKSHKTRSRGEDGEWLPVGVVRSGDHQEVAIGGSGVMNDSEGSRESADNNAEQCLMHCAGARTGAGTGIRVGHSPRNRTRSSAREIGGHSGALASTTQEERCALIALGHRFRNGDWDKESVP
ncbi:hypothetical protein JOM56_000908 [Amanita muscaria]